MPKMRLVSLDWDFVFPCVDWFDWGHKESLFFIESMWPMRWGNHHLKTGVLAHEHVVVDKGRLEWLKESVLPSLDPLAICIAESHAAAPGFMKSLEGAFRDGFTWSVWNFDAHHDLSYGQKKVLECGNWVQFAIRERKVASYNLIYPSWRREEPEGSLSSAMCEGAQFHWHYSDDLQRKRMWTRDAAPVVLFLCRSGAWTPSWCDHEWMGLLDRIKSLYPYTYSKRMSFQEFPEINLSAIKARVFDEEAAHSMELQTKEFMGKFEKERGGH